MSERSMAPEETYFVCLEELSEVLFEDPALRAEVLDVLRDAFGRHEVVKLVALCEVELNKPCGEHHPLRHVLSKLH
jgi:hypothetical protein